MRGWIQTTANVKSQPILTPASSASQTDRLLAKVSLRLLPFLLVLYVISYLDRINLSFAALQMNGDLHLQPEAYGFGGGIFFFGYCAFGIPSNLIIARLGPRRWISTIMIAWGLVTLCMCLVHDKYSFFVLRFILGVAEAGFFPGMLLYLTSWFPADKYGMAVARFMTAIPIAGVLGSFIAAPALALSGFAGLAGWKWLFIVTGLPAVLFGILAFFLLVDKPSHAKWLTSEEGLAVEQLTARPKAKLEQDLDSAQSGKSEGSIAAAFTSPIVWRFALIYFSMSVCMYGFQLWLPQIVQTISQTPFTSAQASSQAASQTALLSAIPALFQGLGMLMIAGSSDRSGERRWHLVAAALTTCAGLVAACLLPDGWPKLGGLSLAAFGLWGTLGPFWAFARSCLQPLAQPAAIAFINSIGGLGGFVGPYLVGLVKQSVPALLGPNSDFAGALVLLAGAAIVTALLAATIKTPLRSIQ